MDSLINHQFHYNDDDHEDKTWKNLFFFKIFKY